MRALDVIGKDFQLGLGIGGGTAIEQQRLEALRRVGLLASARDRHLAEIGRGSGAASDAAHDLVAARSRPGVADGGDDLEHLLAPGDDDAAQFEMRALVQRHVERDAAIGAAAVDDMQVEPRPGRQCDGKLADCGAADGGVLHDHAAGMVPSGDVDHFGRHRPGAFHRRDVAVAPVLVTAARQC